MNIIFINGDGMRLNVISMTSKQGSNTVAFVLGYAEEREYKRDEIVIKQEDDVIVISIKED